MTYIKATVTSAQQVQKILTVQPSVVGVITGTQKGPKGDPGEQGPIGPAGNGNSFVFNQQMPATVWTIQHNFGRYPQVTIYNAANDKVWAHVHNLDQNTVEIIFAAANSGTAILD